MVKKNKKFEINIKNMGVDIDKNEYREVVLSDLNRPGATLNTLRKKYSNKSPKNCNNCNEK